MRVLGLLRSRRIDDDLCAELDAHVAMHADDGLLAGLSPAEARRQALLRLGGKAQITNAYREQQRLTWFETLMQATAFAHCARIPDAPW